MSEGSQSASPAMRRDVPRAVGATAPGAPLLILASTIAVGVLDGLFATVLYVVMGTTTVEKLFQGIASALIGPAAFRGGAATFALGVALHFTVALAWSVIFLLALRASKLIPRMLAWRLGALDVAVWFGPLVYVAMSMLVIPLFTHRVAPINTNWVVVLVGHIPFVGLPIAMIVGRAAPHWKS
ncbi:MAG: hypothetical protein ABI601_02550 [bacterium]